MRNLDSNDSGIKDANKKKELKGNLLDVKVSNALRAAILGTSILGTAAQGCSDGYENGMQNRKGEPTSSTQEKLVNAAPFGQSGSNVSPQVIWTDQNNGYAVWSKYIDAASDYNIVIATTNNGGTSYSAEQNIDDSQCTTKINSILSEDSIAICPPGSACDGYGFVSTSVNINNEVIKFAWNHSTKKASNCIFLGAPINDGNHPVLLLNLNEDGSQLLHSKGTGGSFNLYSSPSITLDSELAVQGIGISNAGAAIINGNLIVGVSNNCGNIGQSDNCAFTITDPGSATTPMIVNNKRNANQVFSPDIVNTTNTEGDPSADYVKKKMYFSRGGTIMMVDFPDTGDAGGAGGSAGSAGAGGSAGTGPDAGDAGGAAGSAGTGGVAGSAGLGGSAGEAGSAGTAGVAGSAGEAGKGGSAGTGGLGGSAGEAGSAGTGGAAGLGGSAGEAGSAGTGGTAGSGGSGPDCFAKVDNTANFDVTNCTADTVEANVKAPVKIEIAGKTIDCFEGQGTIKYVLPNVLTTSTGLECEKSEDPSDPNKLINTEFGWTFGFEGTKTRPSIPAELNPQKAQGKYVIGMMETKEGQQRVYKSCTAKDVKQCEPENVSGLDNGAMPAGTKVYFDLVNKTATIDPSKLTQTPPVTQENGDGGGCSVCSIKTPGEGQDSTRNALLVMGLLAAGAMARRRR